MKHSSQRPVWGAEFRPKGMKRLHPLDIRLVLEAAIKMGIITLILIKGKLTV